MLASNTLAESASAVHAFVIDGPGTPVPFGKVDPGNRGRDDPKDWGRAAARLSIEDRPLFALGPEAGFLQVLHELPYGLGARGFGPLPTPGDF